MQNLSAPLELAEEGPLEATRSSGRDTSAALMFIGLVAAGIFGLVACCACCVCVRRRCVRLGEKDSVDSEPDFWTSNVRPLSPPVAPLPW